MENKLVSIIIPCYNQGLFLDETLQSVYNQIYKNWECIIVDDGSTDNSATTAKKWAAKDSRFQYFFKENSGVSDARNFGMQCATGEYIQFLDSDDFLMTEKLSKSMEEIAVQKVDIICTNFMMFSTFDKPLQEAFSDLASYSFNFDSIVRYWNSGFTVPLHCFLTKRSYFDNIGFPSGLSAQEDWVIWVLIFQKNPTIYFLNESLALYRIHDSSRTSFRDVFPETLQAIRFLKNKLSCVDFEFLYEATIEKFNARLTHAQSVHNNLKASNTYFAGTIIKKILTTFSLLSIAKKFVPYISKLKK